MKEKFKEIWQKTKNWFNELFIDDGGTTDFIETNEPTKKRNKNFNLVSSKFCADSQKICMQKSNRQTPIAFNYNFI